MKALLFLPFTFACGAEGFALFAPYLIFMLCVLHIARGFHHARRAMPAAEPEPSRSFDIMPEAQPAL